MSAPGIAAIRSVPSRVRGKLSRREWRSIVGMAGLILGLHVIGWGVLITIVAPAQYQIAAGQALGIGLGVTAYTLGMRHAFDADHIAAIDNTTRKLMAEGERPVSVGFWFSLGHSSIVFGLVGLLAFGVRALAGQVEDSASLLQRITGVVGTVVSGAFLYLIGIINLVILIGILKVFRKMRQGEYDEESLEDQLNNRGFMNRILSGATKTVSKPWQMYPVGVLFGFGFDTATEVGLLVLAGALCDTARLQVPCGLPPSGVAPAPARSRRARGGRAASGAAAAARPDRHGRIPGEDAVPRRRATPPGRSPPLTPEVRPPRGKDPTVPRTGPVAPLPASATE